MVINNQRFTLNVLPLSKATRNIFLYNAELSLSHLGEWNLSSTLADRITIGQKDFIPWRTFFFFNFLPPKQIFDPWNLILWNLGGVERGLLIYNWSSLCSVLVFFETHLVILRFCSRLCAQRSLLVNSGDYMGC